jgi:uncharacterized protein with GYD domain
MANYVVLVNWTDQGVRSVSESTQRAEQVTQMVESLGGRTVTLLWTLGRYDLVAILEAPDDETVATMGLRAAMGGGTRTEILRAFDADEMKGILANLS